MQAPRTDSFLQSRRSLLSIGISDGAGIASWHIRTTSSQYISFRSLVHSADTQIRLGPTMRSFRWAYQLSIALDTGSSDLWLMCPHVRLMHAPPFQISVELSESHFRFGE